MVEVGSDRTPRAVNLGSLYLFRPFIARSAYYVLQKMKSVFFVIKGRSEIISDGFPFLGRIDAVGPNVGQNTALDNAGGPAARHAVQARHPQIHPAHTSERLS